MNLSTLITLVVGIVLPLVGASPTITQNAIDTPSLSILVSLLTQAELADTFNDANGGPFTVFAPVNASFGDLGNIATYLQEDYNVDLLTKVLQHHVVSGDLNSGALQDGDLVTLEGSNVTIALGGSVDVTSSGGTTASVVVPNVDSSNGVVHVVDTVLVPANTLPQGENTVVEVVANELGLTGLVSLLQAASSTVDLLSLLSSFDEPFTVFAPSNEAVAAVLAASDPAPSGQDLVDILLLHVVQGSIVDSATLIAGGSGTVTTAGGPIQFNVNDLTLTAGSNSVTLDADNLDARGWNGIVHVIDGVILPAADDSSAPKLGLGSLLAASLMAMVLVLS
mmetsp:Transcript_656/g.790  ORF Transcript_656/g.790 Transcript_656/m.790 type:complete len:337 (+) Transcript_656:77-1087(+)